MGLKITNVSVMPVQLPLVKPISSALGRYTHVDCVVVRVHTADGPTGTGFSAGLGGEASRAMSPYIDAELTPRIIGQDALSPDALWHMMWAANKPRLRAGIGAWALSAIDIALWDIVAKAAGLPLITLLGGFRRTVPVYGTGGWHTLSDAELIEEAQSFVAQGITAYKYKTGTNRDRARTELLRRELGDDVTLLADANQRFNVRDAIEHSRMLVDYGVAWLEEPVLADTIDDLAEVADNSAVPVAAGENAYFRWEFREIVERRAAAYLQPDVGRVGGVSEFRRVAALADAFSLSLSSHLWHELSISLVGASPVGYMCEYAELIPPGTLTREFPVVDGAIEVPDVAGHGVEFTEDALQRFAL
jgi:L-alanine-DL-glutamate epimerase-like enolase superfamily enzyme